MKTTIETTNEKYIELLKPIIQICENFEGHINASKKDADMINTDNLYKELLRERIKNVLPEGFRMGAGSSHIWIAASELKENFCQTPHERILLITDNE